MTLPRERLIKHLSVLRQHHSRDPSFLKSIVQQIYAMAPKKPSWRCYPCWKVNQHTHKHCPECGLPWGHVWDSAFIPPQNNAPAEQYYAATNWDAGPWASEERQHTAPRTSPETQPQKPKESTARVQGQRWKRSPTSARGKGQTGRCRKGRSQRHEGERPLPGRPASTFLWCQEAPRGCQQDLSSLYNATDYEFSRSQTSGFDCSPSVRRTTIDSYDPRPPCRIRGRDRQDDCKGRIGGPTRDLRKGISSQESPGRCREIQSDSTYGMAPAPIGQCGAMERLCHRVLRARWSPQATSRSCSRSPPSGSKGMGRVQRTRRAGDFGPRGKQGRDGHRHCHHRRFERDGGAAGSHQGEIRCPTTRATGQKIQRRFFHRWSAWIWSIGAFCQGQVIDSSVVPWPNQPLDGDALKLRYQHSVCHRHDFLSTWIAREDAVELAWECGYDAPSSLESPWKTSLPRTSRNSDAPRKSVHFASLAQLYEAGLDTPAILPLEAFAHCPCKPWGLDLNGFDDQISRWCEGAPLSAQAVLSPTPTTDFLSSDHSMTWHSDAQLPQRAFANRSSGAPTSERMYPVSDSDDASSDQDSQDDLPPDESAPRWIRHLWTTVFARQAERDHRRDQLHITVLSWYLDHFRHRECREGRAIALNSDWRTWDSILQEFWRDRIDPSTTYEVDLISPEPFRSAGEFHQAQIMITQHRALRAPIPQEHEDTPKRLWRCAKVLRSHITKDVILQHIPGPDIAASSHLIWVLYDHNIIAYEPHRIPQGASIEVIKVADAPPRPSQSRTYAFDPGQDEGDEVQLLARQLHPRPQEDDLFCTHRR